MPLDLGPIAARLERKKKGRPEWLDDVDAQDMLEELGIEKIYVAGIDELNFSCPFPGHDSGDTRPSAYMNNGAKSKRLNTVYKCHGCGAAGNAVGFVADFLGVSRQKASQWLRDRYAPGYRAPKGGSMAREWELRQEQRVELERERAILLGGGSEDNTLPWEMYHDRFGFDWSLAYDDKVVAKLEWVQYILGRGFTPADLEEWAIGYDSHSDRVTIPVCDPDGNLLGIKGRSYRPGRRHKYQILGDTEKSIRARGKRYGFAPYEKSLVVFGLDKWGEQSVLVFVEGEIDVMSLWKMGIPAVCTGSAHLSERQAYLLRDYCDEVVIFLDQNTAGDVGVWGYEDKDGIYHPGAVAKLSPYIRVRIVGQHIWDPNEYMTRNHEKRVHQLIRNARSAVRLQVPAGMV